MCAFQNIQGMLYCGLTCPPLDSDVWIRYYGRLAAHPTAGGIGWC
jgi:hypothetical protein